MATDAAEEVTVEEVARWLRRKVEETRNVMGAIPRQYVIRGGRRDVAALLAHEIAQGLDQLEVKIEEYIEKLGVPHPPVC